MTISTGERITVKLYLEESRGSASPPTPFHANAREKTPIRGDGGGAQKATSLCITVNGVE